jgi:enoyl-CoA hydratase/carnithine racemase
MPPAEPEPPLLLREDHGAVALLVLNRPKARNSLSLAMLQALRAALAEIAGQDAVRCVVLAAEGPVFCAGHDLKELTAHRADADAGRAFFTRAMAECAALMQDIVHLPQPVIAAVQGVATAAGCQLVASCDLAVAEEDAKFCTPGVDIGLFCSTPAVALARAVPRKQAMEMLLTGDMITADTALRLGLVNHVVMAMALRPGAMALAKRVAARSGVTVRLGKAGFQRQVEKPLAEAYADAAAVMVENLLTEDAAEGIEAFLARRPATWRHR